MNANNPEPVSHEPTRLPHAFTLESFGVTISIESNSKPTLAALRKAVAEALPLYHRFRPGRSAQHRFAVIEDEAGGLSVTKDGQPFFPASPLHTVVALLASRLRSLVAEFAEGFVFVHAGVVALDGRAILIPANSMAGKTTLVAEMIKRGALYYSDEFAILDRDGLVWPFPKTLSMRGEKGKYEQVEYRAKALGGKTGSDPIPVGTVVVTEFKESAEFTPVMRTPVEGVLDVLASTISTRTNPEFTLEVLKKVAETAVFLRSDRGEAGDAAESILAAVKPRQ